MRTEKLLIFESEQEAIQYFRKDIGVEKLQNTSGGLGCFDVSEEETIEKQIKHINNASVLNTVHYLSSTLFEEVVNMKIESVWIFISKVKDILIKKD